MVRVLVGVAAWAAGTVIAVSVAWLGANVVVRNAGVGPGIPVINAAVLPASAAPSSPAPTPPAAVTPAAVTPTAVTPTVGNGRPSPGPAVAERTSPSASGAGRTPSAVTSSSAAAGTVRAYPMVGGNVTLNVTGNSVQLVTAVPDAGYSVQTWSGTGWLRVDFSSGPQVSSLIASWYQHAPTITVTN
ncbi:MAG: hypothetical protein ACRDOI_08900 [Trebonia sp.]